MSEAEGASVHADSSIDISPFSAHNLNALRLTCLGAIGTALGGLLVILQPDVSYRRLGLLQGLAAGLMLSLAVFDLVPASLAELGPGKAYVGFFVGVALFSALITVIPEPPQSLLAQEEPASGRRKPAPSSSRQAGSSGNKLSRQAVLMSGVVTALGIALHNYPEGCAVYLASLKSAKVGTSLAIAIALHNIPEGCAVALPVYFATRSRWRGFQAAFISGLTEPLAVVVQGMILHVRLSHDMVELMLAAVAGIMTLIAFQELLPLAFEHSGRTRTTWAVFIGMAVMAANLYLMDVFVGGP